MRAVNIMLYLAIIILAIYPHPVTPFLALALLAGAYFTGRTNKRRVTT